MLVKRTISIVVVDKPRRAILPLVSDIRVVKIGDGAISDRREYIVRERAFTVLVEASRSDLLQIRIIVAAVAAGRYRCRETAAAACYGVLLRGSAAGRQQGEM